MADSSRDAEVLRTAAKLLPGYFRPSRAGAAASAEFTGLLNEAVSLLKLAAARAAAEAGLVPGTGPDTEVTQPVASWLTRNQAAAGLQRGDPPFSAHDASHLLDVAAATGRMVTAAVSITTSTQPERIWFSVLWHEDQA